MLTISSCSMKSISNSSNKQENIFIIETVKDNKTITGGSSANLLSDNNRYEIIATSADECKLYVSALNYLSQLVKCKAYAVKNTKTINK